VSTAGACGLVSAILLQFQARHGTLRDVSLRAACASCHPSSRRICSIGSAEGGGNAVGADGLADGPVDVGRFIAASFAFGD
jgi:hypothetical protein